MTQDFDPLAQDPVPAAARGEDLLAPATVEEASALRFSALASLVLAGFEALVALMIGSVSLMAIAIILAVLVMLFAAKPIGDFVDEHPTIKILALSFLMLVGVTLMVEGFDVHVPKGYIYFAMAFSVTVEMLNLRMRKKREGPLRLRKSMHEPADEKEGA